MSNWLRVFKFPSVERGSYDQLERTAKHQIYPIIGEKIVGDITSADIKALLNHWMNQGYAYTTVKKVYNLLNDYFRYLTQQELITKNPMDAAPTIKRANFLSAATNLVNGIKQPDGTIRSLSPRQVADLLGHSTSEITELYYVRKDTSRLAGITTGFDF